SHASIVEIQKTLARKSCSQDTKLAANPPTVKAGIDYSIPKSTPLVLKGMGSSSDGSQITYTWEQNDAGTKATTYYGSFAYPTKPDGPLFRSVMPAISPIRDMPDLKSVLQNKLTTDWESVSTISRTLHFSLTARNNAALGLGQNNSDEMKVNVSDQAGPFT
ncbi:propanediol utilization protein, partial [Flavobacterium sp. IR1]